jgi:hypothetical protein
MRMMLTVLTTLAWRIGVVRLAWALRLRRLLSIAIVAVWTGAAVGFGAVRRFLPQDDDADAPAD